MFVDLGEHSWAYECCWRWAHRSVERVPAAWIEAHGHAQVFDWIGSFILAIGYYSRPKLRQLKPFALAAPWTSQVTSLMTRPRNWAALH
jgi:hypothetical protein